jgi:Zn finger protein HypA/HybF involved in hydrogenase expression
MNAKQDIKEVIGLFDRVHPGRMVDLPFERLKRRCADCGAVLIPMNILWRCPNCNAQWMER